jgi:glycosyltransferase involved in cell wall biosynthesis
VSHPFFTVAVPTKDRPDRVGSTVRSVLEQSFEDFEIVVCDNSDEADAGRTAATVEAFDDARVRYIRTSGDLSMPDNWERAIADARGEYVGILTDRSVFRRDALEVVHAEIETTGAQLVTWFNDLYGKSPSGKEFKRRACTLKRYQHTSATILDYFIHGNPKYSTKVIPKLMTSVCHRSVLEAIRSSAIGRCCPPVAPDFTSGFLMLAHCDWVLTLDEALYVSVGSGNGSDFRRGGELADRFRRDLGMEWHEIVDRMPSEACFSHALVLNDLMRLRDALPGRLQGIELDARQYYLGCINDYVKAARHGARRDEDLAALVEALEQEPSDVKDPVQATRLYRTATAPGGVQEKVKGESGATPPPDFDTVFDAMDWDAANPREAAAMSLVELQYGLDQLYEKPRARKSPRVKADALPAADHAVGAGEPAAIVAIAQQRAATRFPMRLRGLLSRARAPR